MNLTVRIPDDIATRLTEAGVDAEHVALAALSQAADALGDRQQTAAIETKRRTPAEAVARMRQARAGNVLPAGVTIRDLMTYGRS